VSHAQNADDLTVTRAELELLAEKLATVSDLSEEMAIALTGQSRNSDGGLGIRRPQPGSREPYPLHLEALICDLTNELSTTVRHICEVRGLPDTAGGCASMAKWLIRYRMAIAVMPDGGEIFESLCKVIDRCARAMNQTDDEYVIDQQRWEAANRQVVTIAAIEKLAPRIDKLGKGLNARRMRTLCKHAGLTHVSEDPDTGTRFYRLGDVLEAHQRHASRKRA
jgi:hypothetical protein